MVIGDQLLCLSVPLCSFYKNKEQKKEVLCTDGRQRLHDVAVVDEAGVWQQGGAAEAGQRPPLSPQQHQVAGRHLGEVGEAASDTCSPRERPEEWM